MSLIKKKYPLEIRKDLLESIREISKKEQRSLNMQMNYFLQQAFENYVLTQRIKREKFDEIANEVGEEMREAMKDE